jgi:hypothetical protein
MKKKNVVLGQVKDVPKITRTILDHEIEKMDEFASNHPELNVIAYEFDGGRDREGITKGAMERIKELNEMGYNIIFNSDEDTEVQIENLKNNIRIRNIT